MRRVVALAGFFSRIGQLQIVVQQLVDGLLRRLADRALHGRLIGQAQQTLELRLLTQQLGACALAQGFGVGRLVGRMQWHAVDASDRKIGQDDVVGLRTHGAATTTTAAGTAGADMMFM